MTTQKLRERLQKRSEAMLKTLEEMEELTPVELKSEANRDFVEENRAPAYVRGRRKKNSDKPWGTENDYYTSICFNKDQYILVTKLAYEMQMSVKKMMYLLIEEGLESKKYHDNVLRIKNS